jgi:hypothetical protein
MIQPERDELEDILKSQTAANCFDNVKSMRDKWSNAGSSLRYAIWLLPARDILTTDYMIFLAETDLDLVEMERFFNEEQRRK